MFPGDKSAEASVFAKSFGSKMAATTEPSKETLPGAIEWVAATGSLDRSPKTLSRVSVPTYTLPLAIVGTANLTAGRGGSLDALVALE
jgi:hypothetical protein